MTFDGATADPMQRAVRDALIAFMAATARGAGRSYQGRSAVDHAKANDGRSYLGRKPSYTREQFGRVRTMLESQTLGVAQIAEEAGITRQTVYRIKDDPAGAEAALVV